MKKLANVIKGDDVKTIEGGGDMKETDAVPVKMKTSGKVGVIGAKGKYMRGGKVADMKGLNKKTHVEAEMVDGDAAPRRMDRKRGGKVA